MTREKIIIDCDPGVDDCIALLLAFACPDEIEIVGITTVAGNVSLDLTTRNALKICQLAGQSNVPVYAGCQGAMFPVERHVASSHGLDGLVGIEIGDTALGAKDQHAVDFIIDAVNRNPGQVTLCVLGPMTNIAVALLKEPNLTRHIKRIAFMGGAAFCAGNMTPAAEFNIWFDPHAAQIVLRSGIPLIMIGLDATNKVVMTEKWINEFRRDQTQLGTAIADLMTGYGKGDDCLHDPCVIAYLLDESLFGGLHAAVEVDCISTLNRGRTVVSTPEFLSPGQESSCKVIITAKTPDVLQLLRERLLPL